MSPYNGDEMPSGIVTSVAGHGIGGGNSLNNLIAESNTTEKQNSTNGSGGSDEKEEIKASYEIEITPHNKEDLRESFERYK
jgi:hypothetical protein